MLDDDDKIKVFMSDFPLALSCRRFGFLHRRERKQGDFFCWQLKCYASNESLRFVIVVVVEVAVEVDREKEGLEFGIQVVIAAIHQVEIESEISWKFSTNCAIPLATFSKENESPIN